METEREGKFYRVRTNEGIDIGRACIKPSGSGFLVMDSMPGIVMRLEQKAGGEKWRSANPVYHSHHWQVYSTSLEESSILVRCLECGVNGFVMDVTDEEWSQAFYAQSRPYLWQGGDLRVCVR